jgi:hypothetical protein
MPDFLLERMINSMMADVEPFRNDRELEIADWYNLWYHFDKITTVMKNRKEGRSDSPSEEQSFKIEGQLY